MPIAGVESLNQIESVKAPSSRLFNIGKHLIEGKAGRAQEALLYVKAKRQ